jgi:hypothetical protein
VPCRCKERYLVSRYEAISSRARWYRGVAIASDVEGATKGGSCQSSVNIGDSWGESGWCKRMSLRRRCQPTMCVVARESRCGWRSVKSLPKDMPQSSCGVLEWSLEKAATVASSKCAFGRSVGAVGSRKEVNGG